MDDLDKAFLHDGSCVIAKGVIDEYIEGEDGGFLEEVE